MIRALILMAVFVAAPAQAACRLALALGLDVSGSVDRSEYRLQFTSMAAALTHPEVQDSLFSMPTARVRLAVFEWSGPGHQHLLVEWTEITDKEVLEVVAGRIARSRRHSADPSTALGTAMLTGAALLAQQPDCWKRTLDISGDGKQNTGPHPRAVKQGLDPRDLTINALVIGADGPRYGDVRQTEIAELSSYFQANVLLGPDSFVETALGFEEFEDAMVRKLKREMESPALSWLGRTEPFHQ